MNTELFIARKLFFGESDKTFLSHKIIRIALVAIALGLTVMIISVAVVTGFKNEIRNKVIGFGSHIQIVNFDSNNSYETRPIPKTQAFIPKLENLPGVQKLQVFATKPGMIKTDEYIQGIVFKGVDTGYDWSFFEQNLTEGKLPAINDSVRSNEILISEQVSKLLEVVVGERVVLFFVNEDENNPRMLQLTV